VCERLNSTLVAPEGQKPRGTDSHPVTVHTLRSSTALRHIHTTPGNDPMLAGRRNFTTVMQLLLLGSIASLGEGIRTTQLRPHHDTNSTTKGTGHLIFQHKLSVPWVSVDTHLACVARTFGKSFIDDTRFETLRVAVRMGGVRRVVERQHQS
jgi:hypothetical protein